jgi:hypothetical protein
MLLGGGGVAAGARAQQRPVIGFLSSRSADDSDYLVTASARSAITREGGVCAWGLAIHRP